MTAIEEEGQEVGSTSTVGYRLTDVSLLELVAEAHCATIRSHPQRIKFVSKP